MTPEQLSTAIVDVLTPSSTEGAITLPDGVPATVTVERPRQKGHGDYATNVALQLAKKAGINPRDVRRAGRRSGSRPADGVAGGRDRRPGLPQHHGRGRRPGRGRRARSSRPGRRTAASTRSPARRSTSSSSPPTRPARSTSAASAGRPSATRSAGSSTMTGAEVTREYYFNDHGAQIDRFSRSLLAQRPGRAGAGGRVRRRLHRRDRRRRSSPTRPDVLDLPDDEAQEVFRAERRRA